MGFSNFKNTGSGGGTGATGATGAPGAAATIAVDSVITGAAGSSAAVVNVGTSSAAAFKFTIPKGDKGDTGATGAPGAAGSDNTALYNALWALKWTEKFIINSPADGFVSDVLPLTRNGTMATMDFHVKTAGSNVVITVKQNGTALAPSVTLGSTAGKTTLTFSTAVTGVVDDLFTYTVVGAGLASSSVMCNQKWVNR